MKEIREIVKAYHQTLPTGRKMALATVVKVEGSSYRRAGARMLVDDEGNMTGAISGGCLEGDALRKAQLVMARNKPAIVVYDTSDEEDATIGVQLGCAGVIHVLFEPIGPHHHPLPWFEALEKERQPAVLVTLFQEGTSSLDMGVVAMLTAKDTLMYGIPEDLQPDIVDFARSAFSQGSSIHTQFTYHHDTVFCFAEYIPPPILLVVVGAGNDAIPLVNIGTELGWQIKVVDGRSTHAKPERFAAGCQVLVRKPEKVLEEIGIDNRTFFVLMTHNYQYDLAMLKALLAQPPNYIGILGPRKKLERMLEELQQAGLVITEEMLERIYGPVGLELGAETAEEIALSIIAEVMAVVNQASGRSLRMKSAPIHAK